MSGGVDSAVALLRAGPKAIGVTLRLWLDPAGPGRRARLLLAGGGDRRARDLPRARAAARDARSARGVPARGRRAVRRRRTHAARRRTRAAAATATSASTSCSRSPTGPAPRSSGPATTRGSSSATAAACSRARPIRTRISPTCSRRSIRPRSTRVEFPLGGQSKAETRAEAAAAGLDVAERRESQEACFLAGDDYRAFLERQGLERAAGAIVDEARPRARPARRASGASPPASGAGSASPRPSRSTRSAPTRPRTPSSSARAARSPAPRSR